VTDLAGPATKIQDRLQSCLVSSTVRLSAVFAAAHYQSTLDAATAFAMRAHARQAIASWRHLAGLDNSPNEAASVNNRREVASQAEFVLAR
jgi:hypothetical protein